MRCFGACESFLIVVVVVVVVLLLLLLLLHHNLSRPNLEYILYSAFVGMLVKVRGSVLCVRYSGR